VGLIVFVTAVIEVRYLEYTFVRNNNGLVVVEVSIRNADTGLLNTIANTIIIIVSVGIDDTHMIPIVGSVNLFYFVFAFDFNFVFHCSLVPAVLI